jgi:hypothetical protein
MTPVQAMTLAVCVLLVLHGITGILAERWRRRALEWAALFDRAMEEIEAGDRECTKLRAKLEEAERQ